MEWRVLILRLCSSYRLGGAAALGLWCWSCWNQLQGAKTVCFVAGSRSFCIPTQMYREQGVLGTARGSEHKTLDGPNSRNETRSMT